ncbi:MAG: serine/threonine protein kinase [Myxococcales bacterium]|nr:serine/threonine protein kinase [Myxococcales bacterium]
MDEGIPKNIGRYEIDRLLGSGAMGFVFLGRDPELDRPVAIKTVRDLKMDSDALALFLERFRNEARAAARLHHPNIVQVYDVGEEPEIGPYLVFEYVAGSTLKQIIKSRGPLTPAAVVRLAEEVADALAVAHDAEIIHRDIKPDNLLVTPSGKTKLADFGVARIPNAALTREGQFLGTPCYAAPETLSKGQYGPESDIFSFAAVLYEAAAGVRAFPGTDALEVAHKVIHDEPDPVREVAIDPQRIPRSVEAVIMRGLSKDPTQRYGDALELAQAIHDAYIESGLVTPADLTRPPSRRVSTQQAAIERPRGSLAFVAVLVGGLAIGIALVFAFDEPSATPLSEVDASVAPEEDAGRSPLEDAGVEVPDSSILVPLVVDAGVVVVDAGRDAGASSTEREMTPHEREEAAKDALARARAALEDGDLVGARGALEEARRFDPGNADIHALQGRVDEASANEE